MFGRFTFFDTLVRVASLVAKAKKEAEKEKKPSDTQSEQVIHDLRGVPRTKDKGKSKGSRNWSKITGITIHQTAVPFGTDPKRMLNIPVHGATLKDGSIVLLHSPTAYLWHGNSFNRHDIGIEVSCRACGIDGVPETLWLPKKYKDLEGEQRLAKATEATDQQLEATRQLVKYYVDLVAENGGEIKYIHAHRQSSKTKISDPGSRIYKGVNKWAIEELGLSAGPPGWSSGGSAIPDAWSGENNGIPYSWRVPGLLPEAKDDSKA